MLFVNCLYESCWDCLQDEWCCWNCYEMFYKDIISANNVYKVKRLLRLFAKWLNVIEIVCVVCKVKKLIARWLNVVEVVCNASESFMYLFHFTLRMLFTKKNDVVEMFYKVKRLFALFKVAFKLLLVSLYRHWKHWFAHSKNSTVDA